MSARWMSCPFAGMTRIRFKGCSAAPFEQGWRCLSHFPEDSPRNVPLM